MTKGALLGLVLTTVLAGCRTAPAAPPPSGGDRIYVTNQDAASVTIIDAVTYDVVETVDLQALGFSSNAKPHHAVASPDGSVWFVSLIGENVVLKLDARTNRILGRGVFEVPGMLAYDLDSEMLFVGRSMSAVNPPRSIGVIDRDDMSVEEIAVVYPRPHAIAANPRSVHVYSASLASNQMATVDPVEQDVELQTFMEAMAHGDHATMDHAAGQDMIHTLVDFAVAPDGTTMVGTGEMSGKLLVFDLSDPGRPRITQEVDLGPRPWHPVYSPDGGEVWVPSKANNTVTVVRSSDWTVVDVVEGEGLAEPHGAVFSPDGRRVFVSNSDTKNQHPGDGGTVVVIDASTRDIVEVIPVGRNATGIGTRARR